MLNLLKLNRPEGWDASVVDAWREDNATRTMAAVDHGAEAPLPTKNKGSGSIAIFFNTRNKATCIRRE
eukprot:5218523-Pyramimonas_sp.AAC.1